MDHMTNGKHLTQKYLLTWNLCVNLHELKNIYVLKSLAKLNKSRWR